MASKDFIRSELRSLVEELEKDRAERDGGTEELAAPLDGAARSDAARADRTRADTFRFEENGAEPLGTERGDA